MKLCEKHLFRGTSCRKLQHTFTFESWWRSGVALFMGVKYVIQTSTQESHIFATNFQQPRQKSAVKVQWLSFCLGILKVLIRSYFRNRPLNQTNTKASSTTNLQFHLEFKTTLALVSQYSLIRLLIHSYCPFKQNSKHNAKKFLKPLFRGRQSKKPPFTFEL